MTSTYEFGVDLAKRNTKCRARKCYYPNSTITKGQCRVRKSWENPNQEFPQQHYMHIDCYLNSTLTMKESTERLTSDDLEESKGWNDLDDDLRKRVVKFFTDWEEGNHCQRWEPDSVIEEEKEAAEEEEEEEEGEAKQGKKRKAKGKAEKKPAKKAKAKSDEEKLEEIKDAESEHVYLENTSDTHNKFYEVWTKGANLVTKYGSIPSYSSCKVHIKKVKNIEEAKSEMEKIIKQKCAKGKGYSKADKPE